MNADNIDVLEKSTKLYNKNLFAYSDNNPIVRVDDGGEWWHIAIAAAIGGLVGAAVELGSQIASGEEINWGKVGVSACAGVLSGAVAGATFNVGASIALNAAINGSASIATQMIDNNGCLDRVNWYSVAEDTCIGAVCGAIGGSSFGGDRTIMMASRSCSNTVKNAVKSTGLLKNTTARVIKSQVLTFKERTMAPMAKGITQGIINPAVGLFVHTNVLRPLLSIAGPKMFSKR